MAPTSCIPLVALLLVATVAGCGRPAARPGSGASSGVVEAEGTPGAVAGTPAPLLDVEPSPMDAADRTDAEWKQRLTPLQYEITRGKGTERPGTGEYLHTKTPGTYRCVCCGLELFDSEAKYESGCGWPSFYAAVPGESVAEQRDTSLGMARTEITCRRCGAHLGHVFADGPQPTGRRFCVNSASLRLEPESDAEPAPGDATRDRETDGSAR